MSRILTAPMIIQRMQDGVAANDQLMSAADVASSNARGRLANRIGATSTAQQVASDSVYADALKNSQNLIPQYREAAYDKGYNNLQNQYNMLLQQDQYDYQKYLNDRNLAYDQYNTVENNNLQAYLAEQNRLAAAGRRRRQTSSRRSWTTSTNIIS